MELTYYTLFIVLIEYSLTLRFPNDDEIKYEEKCNNLLKKPYFKIDMVVGKSWHIYYTWNIMEKGCYSLVLKKATPYIIDRIQRNMYDEVRRQPNWQSATLYATFKSNVGKSRKGNYLLIPNSDILGLFEGIPDAYPALHRPRSRLGTAIRTFAMKLVRRGKYLIIFDCDLGVASMAVRKDQFNRNEVEKVASRYDLGDGTPACFKDSRNVTE